MVCVCFCFFTSPGPSRITTILFVDSVSVVYETALWLADNDRLVLRDISARNTLAGARVVMLNPPRRRRLSLPAVSVSVQLRYLIHTYEPTRPLSIEDAGYC